MNVTERFSDRVENYVRYRPGYPPELLATLVAETGLTPVALVADVGCGTGISAELFLRHGCSVFGVEPNAPMRAAAEQLLAGHARFHSVAGTAEDTTLPDASVDYVVAGQAFHWFDAAAARAEFIRILLPAGWVALFWNTRLVDATPFLRAYEELLLEFSTDYAQVDHRNVGPDRLDPFFGGPYEARRFSNRQSFDHQALRGRLLSSSYAPAPGHPRHEPMLAALERLFQQHHHDGRVWFEYETELYFGQLR